MKKTLCVIGGIFLVSALLGAAWIRVTEPNAGSEWCLGKTHTIEWTKSADAPGTVTIRLRRAGAPDSERAVQVIARDIANDLSEPWPVPNDLPEGRYFVRVQCSGEIMGDSPNFTIKSCFFPMIPAPPRDRWLPLLIRTLTTPVTFNTAEKHRERHQWNCLFTLGMQAVPSDRGEFLVGFCSHCADGGWGCADQCRAQAFRGSPLWDAARLRTLVGKTIVKATLSFRQKNTECNSGAWTTCLAKVFFYAGRMGEENPPPSETRILAVSISGTYQIDVTGMMANWLREKDPSYHGDHHNYRMEFVGNDERMEFNNQTCLSWFDNGSLEIRYRD